MKKLLIIAILLSGCSTIDKHVEGWPTLKVTEHQENIAAIQWRCWSSLPVYYKLLGGIVMACAVYDLDAKTCDIYSPSWVPNGVMEHERSHCAGGDHDGVQQALYDRWIKNRVPK